MTLVEDFDLLTLSAYETPQFIEAMRRIIEHKTCAKIVADYFPNWDLSSFSKFALNIKDIEEFQIKLVTPAIHQMLKMTSGGLSVSGLENISPDSGYTIVSNHRDILLDPALFIQHILNKGFHSPWICFGDNLLKSDLVTDLVKMNKGITVKRNLLPRDLMKWSFVLSTMIKGLRQQGHSVWIAQREGRTKDGSDETQPAVIKMLSLTATQDWIAHLKFLRLVPVALSYEYEPCGFRKAREMYLTKRQGSYRKADGEDVLSMREGIKAQKGRIHISIGEDISPMLNELSAIKQRNAIMREVGLKIDRQIQAMYKIWPTHYIASDLMENSDRWADKYSQVEKSRFLNYLNEGLSPFSASEQDGIRQSILEIYTNPLKLASAVRTSGR